MRGTYHGLREKRNLCFGNPPCKLNKILLRLEPSTTYRVALLRRGIPENGLLAPSPVFMRTVDSTCFSTVELRKMYARRKISFVQFQVWLDRKNKSLRTLTRVKKGPFSIWAHFPLGPYSLASSKGVKVFGYLSNLKQIWKQMDSLQIQRSKSPNFFLDLKMLETIQTIVYRLVYKGQSYLAWRGHPMPDGVTWEDLTTKTATSSNDDENPPLPAMRRYKPATSTSTEEQERRPLIVYFHGGGMCVGSYTDTHHNFCAELAKACGCVVVAVDCRLAPDHRFPTPPNDAVAATRWISEHLLLGGDDETCSTNGKLVVAGDSAGGTLAIISCLEADIKQDVLVGAALLYPLVEHDSAGMNSYKDHENDGPLTADIQKFFWRTYLGPDFNVDATNADVIRAFPLRTPTETLAAKMPSTFLATAEVDPLRDEGIAFYEKLKDAGVTTRYRHFGEAEHGFACTSGPNEHQGELMKDLVSWFEALPSS
jgi:acetyl esterase